MGGRLRQPDDEYSRGIVREIRHGGVVVRGGEDVDCERTDAIEARVVAGGVGEWHGVAGREDRVADGGGDGNDRDGGERWRVDEQDDGRGGDDGDDDADNDDDCHDDAESGCSSLFLFDIYV